MTGFWKVFGATALVVAVAVAIVGALALRTLSAAVDEHLSRRVEAETALLAAAVLPPLRAGDPSGLDPQVHALAARLPGDRLTIVAADGRVLADSLADVKTMENHANRDEIRHAGDPHAVPIARTSRTLHEDMVYFALPVLDGDRLLGYARVAVPVADVRAERGELSLAVVWGALLALLVGALAAAALARSVRRPLDAMTGTVQAIARGEPTRPLSAARMGDLAPLARAIDAMSDQLRERFDRIARDQSEIRAIVGAMVEGVLAIDAGQRVVLLNSAGAGLLGTSPEAARGKPVWEVTRLPEITELLARCLRTGEPAWVELQLAGEPRDRVLRLAASPLVGAAGVFGAVLVLHDLTEVRRLEAVRRDFVVNVSHELKTPLTAMRGYLDATLDDPEPPPEVRRRFLSRARDATDRLTAIVGDLLTLARVEADEGTLRRTPLDLTELAAEAQAATADAAALRGAHVQLDASDEPVPVAGDRSELVTAIGNLVDNALKYGPPGGTVRVRVATDGEQAVLEVEDDGPGIPAHETERIWERFYRLDKSRSRELGGTGLGLSIVRNVATAHGGRVSLQSEVGRGSTFRIHLPLRREEPGAVSSGSPPAAAPP